MTQNGKEKILVISPSVPRPDINSGDLRLYSILAILAKEYEVTFVASGYGPADSGYVALLERGGITVYANNFSLKKLLETKKFSLAILEFYFTAEYFLERLRILHPECRVIIDSVDVHYLRLKRKYDLTNAETDHANYLKTKERELSVYRKADAVITVTKDDAVKLLEEHSDITCEVVPNIHELCLSDITPESDSLIFVGGFIHTPNIDAVQYFCSEILPLIKNVKPNTQLTIVGSNPPEQIRMLESKSIRVTGYVPETSSYLHKSNVSVAPLRYGAGMKGKIGEAMAHGVPVVTTSVGAEGMGLLHRTNAMIADSPQHFAAAVLELLNNGSLHTTIRENAIRLIDENYTPEQIAKCMINVLGNVCNRKAKHMSIFDKALFLKNYVMDCIKPRQHCAEVE